MGGTPLLITSAVGKTGPVDDLLKAAGDVNMLTRQSHNAFHMACASGSTAMCGVFAVSRCRGGCAHASSHGRLAVHV